MSEPREETAEQLRHHLDLILSSAGEGIYGLDTEGRVTFVNPAAVEMLGWEADEQLGNRQHDLIHHTRPDGTPYPRAECPIYAAFRDGRSHRVTGEVFWRKDGTAIPVEYVSTPIRDGNRLTGAVVIFRDITLRKQAEDALRESEGRLYTIVDNMPEGVIFADMEGQVFHWNRAALELCGFASLDECRLALPEFQRYFELSTLDGRLVPLEAWPLARVLRGERVANLDLRMHRLDQGWTRIISYGGSVITDVAGKRIGFITMLDISERERARQKLQQQLARLHLLHDISRAAGEHQDPVSVYRVVLAQLEENLPVEMSAICAFESATNSFRVTAVGPRSMALNERMDMAPGAVFSADGNGLGAAVRGRTVYESDLAEVDAPIPRRLAAHGLRSLAAAPLRAADTTIGVLMIGSRQPHGYSSPDCEFLAQLAGHVSLAVQHARMFEDLRSAYENLRHSQDAMLEQVRLRAMGQIASGVAHDINNAISPIAIYAETLIESEPDLSERARNYLATIAQAVDEVAHTVSRMRDFYKEQEAPLELQPVDLNAVAPRIVDLTRPSWRDQSQQRGITIDLKTDLTTGAVTAMGVEGEIGSALTNLVLNAVDAMPEGGTLTIRTRFEGAERGAAGQESGDGRRAVVEVEDTGIGMDEETRNRCLEPFFSTKGERGRGLGLAMVYGVMQRHSGSIEVDSTPGRGTTMRLLFPLAPPVPESAGDSDIPEGVVPRRILVIDDDAVLRKSLQEALQDEGHQVAVAEGGKEGMEVFRAASAEDNPFDVVITDLGMPNMDGRAVAAAIKQISPAAGVILLTGWGQRMKAEGDIPAHVDRMLAKPPKLRDLRAALAGLGGKPADTA